MIQQLFRVPNPVNILIAIDNFGVLQELVALQKIVDLFFGHRFQKSSQLVNDFNIFKHYIIFGGVNFNRKPFGSENGN